MVGAVLTQNAAWTNVEKAIANLKQLIALDAESLLRLDETELANAIRPSGYFNVKTKRLRALSHWLQKRGGIGQLNLESTDLVRKQLLSVHGIGPETADDILLYAVQRPVFVVDAYTRRLFNRIGLIDGGESYDMIRALVEESLHGDIAAMQEFHALIVAHAKLACRNTPRCEDCILRGNCALFQAEGRRVTTKNKMIISKVKARL